VMIPRWSDGRGRVYGQAPLMLSGTPGGGAPQIPDSMPVLRWDRGTDRLDTVLMVPNPMAGGGGAVTMMVRGGGARMAGGQQRAFYPADAWAIAPDGRIALVRAENYHVEWIDANGRRAVGPTIPYERVKVTKADQEQWIQARTAGTQMIVNGRRMTPPAIDPKDVDWAEFKPPFTTASVTPDGELWVLASQPASAKGPLYDVFDSRGERVRQVRLPDGRRVVGFGNGTVYAVSVSGPKQYELEREHDEHSRPVDLDQTCVSFMPEFGPANCRPSLGVNRAEQEVRCYRDGPHERKPARDPTQPAHTSYRPALVSMTMTPFRPRSP